MPFPTPGADLRYEDPGWDLVEYAGLLCLAEELVLSAEDEAITDGIDILEDLGGGRPPEDVQAFHDGLLAELRGLSPLPSATAQHKAEEAFAQPEEHPLLAGVMSFPCEMHYETIGQAMREVSDMLDYGLSLCFAWEHLLWNEEDALDDAVHRAPLVCRSNRVAEPGTFDRQATRWRAVSRRRGYAQDGQQRADLLAPETSVYGTLGVA